MCERACYEHAACYACACNCSNAAKKGKVHSTSVRLGVAPRGDPEVCERHSNLINTLKRKISTNSNIVVRLEGGDFAVGEAAGKPYKLDKQATAASEIIRKGDWVVDMYEYEQSSNSSSTYKLGTEACSEPLVLCGSAKGCYKRHKAKYKLVHVREPVGFVLQPARRGRKRARTASASVDNRLAYTMPGSGSVQATIVQNLNVV